MRERNQQQHLCRQGGKLYRRHGRNHDDPLVLATIPFGASASSGILKTALIEAGYGMLSEAMIQPFVYRYKKTRNSPYDVSDALIRIGAAGVGAGAQGGTIKGAIRGYSRLTRPRLDGIDDILEAFEKTVGEPTSTQRDAAHVLGDYADVMRENPFGLDHPLVDEIHLEATAKAFADLDAGQPVDVRDIIKGTRDVIPEGAMSERELMIFSMAYRTSYRGPSADQQSKPYRLKIKCCLYSFVTMAAYRSSRPAHFAVNMKRCLRAAARQVER